MAVCQEIYYVNQHYLFKLLVANICNLDKSFKNVVYVLWKKISYMTETDAEASVKMCEWEVLIFIDTAKWNQFLFLLSFPLSLCQALPVFYSPFWNFEFNSDLCLQCSGRYSNCSNQDSRTTHYISVFISIHKQTALDSI